LVVQVTVAPAAQFAPLLLSVTQYSYRLMPLASVTADQFALI
jgi:hypothetical protein